MRLCFTRNLMFRLTAFVLKTYAQAQNWIQVDEKEIKEPLNWLLHSRMTMAVSNQLASYIIKLWQEE